MGKRELKFAQLNVNRSKCAHDLLWTDSADCDLILITEPNRALVREKKLISDTNNDVAVIIRNQSDITAVIEVKASDGYVCVEFGAYAVIVCYVSPNVPIEKLEHVLESMQRDLNRVKPLVIAGDLNSKSPIWGSPIEDARGRLVADWLAQNGLLVANHGTEPTFVRRQCRSYLDVTLGNAKAIQKLSNWRVIAEKENLSDHQTIMFEMKFVQGAAKTDKPTKPRWSYKREKEKLVISAIDRLILHSENFEADDLTLIMQEVCKETLEGKKNGRKKPVYW